MAERLATFVQRVPAFAVRQAARGTPIMGSEDAEVANPRPVNCCHDHRLRPDRC